MNVIARWKSLDRAVTGWLDALGAWIGNIQILGEPLRDWPEIIGQTVGGLVLRLAELAVFALVLYGLVKLLKWAWYN